MSTGEGRPVWLYTARYITDGIIGLGPIVGMEIVEIRGLQYGPVSLGPGFGLWASVERVESDLALVNWLLGWVPGPIKPMLSRLAIARMADELAARPAESPAE
jgi:hypothetical protein